MVIILLINNEGAGAELASSARHGQTGCVAMPDFPNMMIG
jgi:hypothetical protein